MAAEFIGALQCRVSLLLCHHQHFAGTCVIQMTIYYILFELCVNCSWTIFYEVRFIFSELRLNVRCKGLGGKMSFGKISSDRPIQMHESLIG